MAEPENTKTIPELTTELFELINAYVRQELKSTVDSTIIAPLRELGKWLAVATVASTLFALASIFIAVGAFQLLAKLVGATWIAYLVIGGLLLLGGIGAAVVAMTGKEPEADEKP